MICGILRLSTKYDVTTLRRRAIALIADECYSPSLDNWIARKGLPLSHPFKGPFPVGFSFNIVNLARETNVAKLLPLWMYMCCQARIEDILDGTVGKDLRWDLNAADKRLCLIAREKIQSWVAKFTQKVMEAYASGVDMGLQECCDDSIERAGFIFSQEDWEFDWYESTMALEHSFFRARSESCEECDAWEKLPEIAFLLQYQQQFWDQLPSMFNLSSWGELVDDGM